MSRTQRSRILAALAGVAMAAVALTGCAGSSAGATGATTVLTLAQVKSPVQLLRNEATARINKVFIDSIVQPTDQSLSCKDATTDPGENWRTWSSGVLVLIKADAAETMNDIQKNLLSSFTEQGWVKTKVGDKVYHLTKPTTFATVDIFVVQPDKVGGQGGQVSITVSGACVHTDGKDSQEVRDLETTS